MAPVHCAAGSDGETNFGVTSLAAPNAASSRVARYSFVARLACCASSFLFHSDPGIDRRLLASAAIRLASTAKPSPPTRPATMHAPQGQERGRGTADQRLDPLVVAELDICRAAPPQRRNEKRQLVGAAP